MIVKVTWQTCDISGIKFVNDRIVAPTQQFKLDAHEASVWWANKKRQPDRLLKKLKWHKP